jgi:hypothetical protein
MSPLLLAALINNFAIPELSRWLASLHEEGRVVTEAEIMAKLNADADEVTRIGLAFLDSHPPTT